MGLNLGTGNTEQKDELPQKGKKEKNKELPASDLKTVLTAIKKDKGDKVVVPGNSIPPVLRQPTGIFELDFNLGGGFPRGRYSIIYGPESSNKTNVALLAIAQAQKRKPPCNKAIFVNVESTFDPLWAQKLGVNVEELLVVNPGYGEECVDLVDALIRAEDVAILVVDSVAALISSAKIAKSTENFDIGTSAMLIKRMVNKMMIAFSEEAKKNHDPCVILINQRRFKPNVAFGDPEVMPGGEAQRFLSSLTIRTYGKNIVDSKTNVTTFKEVNVVVKKAKVPIRAMSFKFSLCVSPFDNLNIGETDSFNMVKNYLQQLGFLEKTSKGYVIEGAEGCWPLLSNLQEEYRKDHDFAVKLQTIINDAMKETILVEETTGPAEIEPGIAVLQETE